MLYVTAQWLLLVSFNSYIPPDIRCFLLNAKTPNTRTAVRALHGPSGPHYVYYNHSPQLDAAPSPDSPTAEHARITHA